MLYFKQYKTREARKQITEEEALKTLLSTYHDNDMTRDMLTIPNRIACVFSTVEVEDDSTTPHMVAAAGVYNLLPMDAVYDDDGNRV